MTRLILLDRDGVINYDSPDYIKSVAEWQPIPQALQAIAELTQAGYTIAVLTNQSGIGRGYYSLDTLADIHQTMLTAVRAAGGDIAAIFYCPHTPDDDCDCRKPKPGLMLQAAKHFSVTLNDVPYVGDKVSDVELAHAVGATAYCVKTGYAPYWQSINDGSVPVMDDLLAVAKHLLATAL